MNCLWRQQGRVCVSLHVWLYTCLYGRVWQVTNFMEASIDDTQRSPEEETTVVPLHSGEGAVKSCGGACPTHSEAANTRLSTREATHESSECSVPAQLKAHALSLCPRVFPQVPYARHTPQLGSSIPVSSSQGHGYAGAAALSCASNVKIVALLCTKPSQPAPTQSSVTCTRADDDGGNDEDARVQPSKRMRLDSGAAGSAGQLTATSRKRSVYVRVQYDKTLIETLPIEIARERHPQQLIDYLLTTAVWS